MHRKHPPLRTLTNHALFLDIDGTLADIASKPSLAFIEPSTIADLSALFVALDGALALVSGRQLEEIDRLTGGSGLPAAGIHGAQLRTRQGTSIASHLEPKIFTQIEADVHDLIRGLDGIMIERKPLAVAIHCRANPDLESHVQSLALSIIPKYAALKLITGKCIAEILPVSVDKGTAIAEFMKSPPFRGRIPIFAGDDVTDEDGFAMVNSMNGVSIKIGSGPSQAAYGLETADAMRFWLSQLSAAV